MKLYVLLGIVLFILGLFSLILRLGSGHEILINDTKSFAAIIGPLIFIISSFLLFGFNKVKNINGLRKLLQLGLLLSIVITCIDLYNILQNWRNNLFYYLSLAILMILTGLLLKFLYDIKSKVA